MTEQHDQYPHMRTEGGKIRVLKVLESRGATVKPHTNDPRMVAAKEVRAPQSLVSGEKSPEELEMLKKALKGGRKYLLKGEMSLLTAAFRCEEGEPFEQATVDSLRRHAIKHGYDPEKILAREDVKQRLGDFASRALVRHQGAEIQIDTVSESDAKATIEPPQHPDMLPEAPPDLVGVDLQQTDVPPVVE
jgi:hypothetical protein